MGCSYNGNTAASKPANVGSIPTLPAVKKKYWYKFDVDYCPICGRDRTIKYRVYEKPKPEDRYVLKEVWDYCDI